MTNLAPETPPSRGISSRLLTMKFMQRAATTGSPAESSPDEPSSKRRKFQNSPLTGDFHSFDQMAVQAALKQQEAKRLSALEKSRAESADTHWVLDGDWDKSGSGSQQAPPNIVYVGYADIDGADGDDESDAAQQVGRKKIGNLKSKDEKAWPGLTATGIFSPSPLTQVQKDTQPTSNEESDSGSSSGSDESSEEDDSSDDNETPEAKPKSKKAARGMSSGGQGRTRVNLQPKKLAESNKAREFRDKRMKKEVKLNSLSSISNSSTAGASAGSGKPAPFNCHNCGKAGHKAAECPNQRKDGKRKSFGKPR